MDGIEHRLNNIASRLNEREVVTIPEAPSMQDTDSTDNATASNTTSQAEAMTHYDKIAHTSPTGSHVFNRSVSLMDKTKPGNELVKLGRNRTFSDGHTRCDYRSPPSRRTRSILYRQGRPRVKKSVSFCSMPEDRRVSNAQECLAVMQEGTELTKIKSNGRLYRRYYWLDEDLQEIRWMPTSKKYNKAKISLDQVKEVRSGKTSDSKDLELVYQDEFVLTILYGSNYATLELVAKSPDDANIWIAGLSHLLTRSSVINGINGVNTVNGINGDVNGGLVKSTMRDRWLTEMYIEAAGCADSNLSEVETVKLLLTLNPAIDRQHISLKLKEIYGSADRTAGKASLTCYDFITLYKYVASRQEIYFLMTRYGSNDHMNAEELMMFLETEQGHGDASKSYCEDLIRKFEPSREGKSKLLLGIDGLLMYLLSSECEVSKLQAGAVHQDMSLPLSDYFINSSHKTYLLEDQLKGPSSVAAYARALQLGCRYIEVDSWDGPEGPVVFHGGTLTSKILFTDVISTVEKYAFSTTQYPLILSIENHCSLDQQKVMVEILVSTLGKYLYTAPINGNSMSLPSPQDLLHKILIKGKKLANDGDESSSHGEVSDEDESVDPDWKRATVQRKEPLPKVPLLRELSDLVTWCQSFSYDTFVSDSPEQKPWQMISVSELYAIKLMQTWPEEFLSKSRQFLVRVHPNCNRVDSSNFNPQEMWNKGCQIVALNQQTQGVGFDLNSAMFKQNGSCGYVLKPALLRDPQFNFNPEHPLQTTALHNVTPLLLQIKVISGYRFPKPRGSGTRTQITDPYVLIEIFGIPSDCVRTRTKTVPGNGQNPFYDEVFTFYVNMPELAMIRFNILDDDYIGDEFIAQYSVPFNYINTGYRHVKLLASSGEVVPGSTLFVHISYANALDKKASRRSGSSMSASRLRAARDFVQIRLVGMKAVDDLSKGLQAQLTEFGAIKSSVENALARFKESCDLSMVANIKLCVKTVAARAAVSPGVTLSLTTSTYPNFTVSGASIPDLLKKTILAYSNWSKECQTLTEESAAIRNALVEMDTVMDRMNVEIDNVIEEAGMKEKKSLKAQENFAWNRRVVKEQLILLDDYVETCQQTFTKVVEAAKLSNIPVAGSDIGKT